MTKTEAEQLMIDNANLLKDEEGNNITYRIQNVEYTVGSWAYINEDLLLYLNPTIGALERGYKTISISWEEFIALIENE